MSNDIFVVVEHLKGKIADISFEMLGKGREIADAFGGKLYAVVIGSQCASLAVELGKADAVLCMMDPRLADFNPTAYKHALGELVRERRAEEPLAGLGERGAADRVGAPAAERARLEGRLVRKGRPLLAAVPPFQRVLLRGERREAVLAVEGLQPRRQRLRVVTARGEAGARVEPDGERGVLPAHHDGGPVLGRDRVDLVAGAEEIAERLH